MKVRLPFVAPHERSRKAQVSAGASRSERSLKVAEKASTGCPSFGGLRTVALPRRQENAQLLQAPLALTRKASYKSVSLLQRREPRFSRAINPQAQFECHSGSLRLQRWYASPSKYKARLRLLERGLTLPSSGPAYGRPLKSNVRRLVIKIDTSPVRYYSQLDEKSFFEWALGKV